MSKLRHRESWYSRTKKELEEMDYKEKYEKALEWMKSIYPTMQGSDKEDAEHYFPELAESEDERIIKTLYEYVKNRNWPLNGPTQKDVLAWLEKQKKNNIPVYDKDSYISARKKSRNSCAEETDLNEMHNKAFSNGYQFGVHEEKPHVWTRHDEAVRKEAIECLKAWEKIIPADYLEDYQNILSWLQKELIIHTDEKQKEPRDYRELYKGVSESEWFKENYKGKSLGEEENPKGWSEADETYLQYALWCVEKAEKSCKDGEDKGACWSAKRWLKSLRPQPKPEWSEEDEKIFNNIIEKAKGGYWIEVNEITWLITRFKFLRPQSKPEWTEEDLQHKSWILECLADGERKMPEYAEDFRAAFDWLNSLRPVPYWKPTEEQMKALKEVAYNIVGTGTATDVYLVQLYEQLKAIKEDKK